MNAAMIDANEGKSTPSACLWMGWNGFHLAQVALLPIADKWL